MNATIEQKAQNLADGLGITVWITEDRLHIVQHKPDEGGIEVLPRARARPTAHGAPVDIKPAGGDAG